MRAFLLFWYSKSVYGHCGFKLFFGANALTESWVSFVILVILKNCGATVVLRCLWCIDITE